MNENVWQQQIERNCIAVHYENKKNEDEDCVKQGCKKEQGQPMLTGVSVWVHNSMMKQKATIVQIAEATQQQIKTQE